MTYQPLHRKPRWHDRPRAWLRDLYDRARGREEEEEELTDDHGNHISDDLPDYKYHDRTAVTVQVDGVHAPLYGKPAPPRPDGYPPWQSPWVKPAFTPDVPRPGECLADTPAHTRKDGNAAGPGYRHLSAFTVPFGAPGRIDRTPRPAPRPVIQWRPRECGGRITALAGAW